MSKSIWTIVAMGFMSLVLMVVMMLFSLTTYKGTEAGNRARFSNLLKKEFGFPEAGATVRDAAGRLVLRIEYLAHTDSKFNQEFMDEELNRVAAFTQEKYDGKDRKQIASLLVHRLEIQGSGCWQSKLDREITVDAPFAPRPKPPTQEPEEEK